MPRLESFSLEILTGPKGGPERPTYAINGFPLDFEEHDGATEAGHSLRVAANPCSFPHSLVLKGPEAGAWDIESVLATYTCSGEEAYTIQLGAVTLDDASDLDIWYERPAPTFDV